MSILIPFDIEFLGYFFCIKIFLLIVKGRLKVLEFVNKEKLSKILDDHNKGKDNRKMIWSLYILEKCIENNLK